MIHFLNKLFPLILLFCEENNFSLILIPVIPFCKGDLFWTTLLIFKCPKIWFEFWLEGLALFLLIFAKNPGTTLFFPIFCKNFSDILISFFFKSPWLFAFNWLLAEIFGCSWNWLKLGFITPLLKRWFLNVSLESRIFEINWSFFLLFKNKGISFFSLNWLDVLLKFISLLAKFAEELDLKRSCCVCFFSSI